MRTMERTADTDGHGFRDSQGITRQSASRP